MRDLRYASVRGQDIGMSGGEGKGVYHYPHPPNVAFYYSTGNVPSLISQEITT